MLIETFSVLAGTIRGSRFVEPIKASVEEWERKLIQFSRALDEWMTCQRNWVYLEQIFNTPDIQRLVFILSVLLNIQKFH